MHEQREGADVDENNLIEALRPFHIDIRVWRDFKRQEILDAIRGVLDEVNNETNKYAGLVILGMSHGEVREDGRDYILASDCKPLLTDTIVTLFHNDRCEGLKNKPKFYLFNMCRGTYPNIELDKLSEQLPSMTDLFNMCYAPNDKNIPSCYFFHLSKDSLMKTRAETKVQISNMSAFGKNRARQQSEPIQTDSYGQREISFKTGDYLLVHSTIKGYISNRHVRYGSVFINELVKSIVEMMCYDDQNFEDVIRHTCSATSLHQFSGANASQLPEFTTTLRFPFRFIIKGNQSILKYL